MAESSDIAEGEAAVKEFEQSARDFMIGFEQFDEDILDKLDPSSRSKLAKTLQDIVGRSKNVLELLKVSCPYCREAGGHILGPCVQCGRDACSLCGRLIDGKPVHSSVCALWYKQNDVGED